MSTDPCILSRSIRTSSATCGKVSSDTIMVSPSATIVMGPLLLMFASWFGTELGTESYDVVKLDP